MARAVLDERREVASVVYLQRRRKPLLKDMQQLNCSQPFSTRVVCANNEDPTIDVKSMEKATAQT